MARASPPDGQGFTNYTTDNAPVHTAAIVTYLLAARPVRLLQHLPDLPDLTPADFFLFTKVKKELAGLTLTRETFMKKWEGAVRTLMEKNVL